MQLEMELLPRKPTDLESQQSLPPLDEVYLNPALKFDEEKHSQLMQEVIDMKLVLAGTKVCQASSQYAFSDSIS